MLDTMAAGRTAGMLQRNMKIHPAVSELIPTVLGELQPSRGRQGCLAGNCFKRSIAAMMFSWRCAVADGSA